MGSSCKNSLQLKAVNYFPKSSILDARLGSEYASDFGWDMDALKLWNKT